MITLTEATIVLLDSGPLGLITNPRANPDALACKAWHSRLVRAGHVVLVPEIIDYEHRRELILNGMTVAERALDRLKTTGSFLPLTSRALLQAARFWAQVRRAGLATADRHALDADVILAAQAATLDPAVWRMPGAAVIIATMNVGHLSRFAIADVWQDIHP